MTFLEATETIYAMMKLNVGAKVCFDSSKLGMQVGTIIKFNQKTIPVSRTFYRLAKITYGVAEYLLRMRTNH